jgi:hypothetical protein
MARHRARTLIASSSCILLTTMATSAASAGSISPSSVSASLSIGETINVVKTVTTDIGGGLIDFLFLADNTGSMGGVISNVQSVASTLLNDLRTTYSGAQFAVARYFGDPSEGVGYGSGSYQVLQTSTADTTAAQTAMNNWVASGGGDGPEANFYALHQALQNGDSTCPGLGSIPGACGGSGDPLNWRLGARKVALWFGDFPSHQKTVTMDNARTILKAANVSLIGFNSDSSGSGIDADFADGGQAGHQARTLISDLGSHGAVIDNFAAVPAADILTTVTNAVGEVTSKTNISLAVVGGAPSGLNVSFSCTDPLGCNDVDGGDSRELTMSISALSAGDYIFDVYSPGVTDGSGNLALERDQITVGPLNPVPGPLPWLGAAVGFGFSRRLRLRLAAARGL